MTAWLAERFRVGVSGNGSSRLLLISTWLLTLVGANSLGTVTDVWTVLNSELCAS